jgi:hypothetical protein
MPRSAACLAARTEGAQVYLVELVGKRNAAIYKVVDGDLGPQRNNC